MTKLSPTARFEGGWGSEGRRGEGRRDGGRRDADRSDFTYKTRRSLFTALFPCSPHWPSVPENAEPLSADVGRWREMVVAMCGSEGVPSGSPNLRVRHSAGGGH